MQVEEKCFWCEDYMVEESMSGCEIHGGVVKSGYVTVDYTTWGKLLKGNSI